MTPAVTRPKTSVSDRYRSAYPDGPDHDPRCLAVLASWLPLYNIPRTGRQRIDGGFRPIGDGIEVHLRPGCGSLSTFDSSGLSELVLAAYRYCCRVEVSAEGRMMIVQVNPRRTDSTSLFERHPDLDDLIATASAMRDADAGPECLSCAAPLSRCGSCGGGAEQ